MSASSILWVLALFPLLVAGCSMDSLVVHSSLPVMKGGTRAMNQETDLALAAVALPANLKFVEGLIVLDPDNPQLRSYAAQGLYGYSFGFVEDEDRARASALYERCLRHALAGLHAAGLSADPAVLPPDALQEAVDGLGRGALPNLFWAGSCWGKWVDMNRADPRRLADLGRAVVLIRRVLALDESYQYGGAHLFLGTYYSSRPPMLGGDYAAARRHFDRARELSGGRVFLVDLLEAQFLDRQLQDRQAFHGRLNAILTRTIEPGSDMALQNRISQRKAHALLAKEALWF